MFQSPSLRGSGRFTSRSTSTSARSSSFNPLHCGAVVASRRHRCVRRMAGACFNPLHCGAVVASPRRVRRRGDLSGFQSPSLRGSGRFGTRRSIRSVSRRAFQSPSLRGSGRFSGASGASGASPSFQSPSLRGSGRFKSPRVRGTGGTSFQSPSLRGSGRFPKPAPRRSNGRGKRFNPLHCGAVVASGGRHRLHRRGGVLFQSPSLRGSGRFIFFDPMKDLPGDVSIPFIAGQWSLLPRTTPSSLFGVLLRKRRLPCDHIICTRLPF